MTLNKDLTIMMPDTVNYLNEPNLTTIGKLV